MGCAEPIVIDGPTPPKLRRQVLAREGGRCGTPRCHHVADHCHHIVFRSQGGKTKLANEEAVCGTCHALIHAGVLRVSGLADGAASARGNQPKPDLRPVLRFNGIMDLMLHFRTQETGIACGEDSATLAGETLEGEALEGTDSIRAAGCRETRRPSIWMKDQDTPGTMRRGGPVDIERK